MSQATGAANGHCHRHRHQPWCSLWSRRRRMQCGCRPAGRFSARRTAFGSSFRMCTGRCQTNWTSRDTTTTTMCAAVPPQAAGCPRRSAGALSESAAAAESAASHSRGAQFVCHPQVHSRRLPRPPGLLCRRRPRRRLELQRLALRPDCRERRRERDRGRGTPVARPETQTGWMGFSAGLGRTGGGARSRRRFCVLLARHTHRPNISP